LKTHDLSHGPWTWVQIPASPKNLGRWAPLDGRKSNEKIKGQATPKDFFSL